MRGVSTIILLILLYHTAWAFETIVPENDPANNVRIENNFRKFFYKKVQVPPSTTSYLYPDTVEVTSNTVLVATSNTFGNPCLWVNCGEGTMEIYVEHPTAYTTEVSVIGINQEPLITE